MQLALLYEYRRKARIYVVDGYRVGSEWQIEKTVLPREWIELCEVSILDQSQQE